MGWHKRFWPNERSLVKLLENNQGFRAHFVFGDRDKIIPYKWSSSLRDKLQCVGNVKFHIIESGHVMRHPDTVDQIKSAIQK